MLAFFYLDLKPDIFYYLEAMVHHQKHTCPDCSFCQFCSETRCRACRNRCARMPRLSIPDQIALFKSLNPKQNEPGQPIFHKPQRTGKKK